MPVSIITPALDLLINLADPAQSGRLTQVGDRIVAVTSSRAQRLPRNCDGLARVRAFVPCQSGERAFDEVNLAGAIVRLAIGIPDKAPSAGSFPLAPLAPQTVGPLVSGKRYLIVSFETGDNFTNVGAAANLAGTIFTAAGTAPTVWTNGSAIQELTADLSISATAAQVEAALNATAAIAALGGVTVATSSAFDTATPARSWWVQFNGFGPQTAIGGPIAYGMTPRSIVSVSRVEPGLSAGVGSVREVQLIRLLANPYCFATLATPAPAQAAAVTEIQPATQDLPATYRLTLDPQAYDGHAVVELDGKKFALAWNASRSQVQFLAGAKYKVEKYSEKAWDFSGIEPAQGLDLSATVEGLVVAGGVTGTIETSTPGMLQAFSETSAAWLKFTRAVDIQFPGRKALKVFQDEIEVPRDLIDLGSQVPPTMLQFQFVASNFAGTPWTYTNTITALRGGVAALEAIDTALLTAGTRYEFLVGGHPVIAFIEDGPADGADVDGQVAPLNYHATLNNKHWRIEGL
jgi:hypothetical protein